MPASLAPRGGRHGTGGIIPLVAATVEAAWIAFLAWLAWRG